MASTTAPRGTLCSPVFVAGRQHSGNTMLAAALGRLPGVLACVEEGNYFEEREAIGSLQGERLAVAVARRIQLNGTPVSDDARDALVRRLTPLAESGASADALFVEGMAEVLEAGQGSRWVQKATSYVFQAEQVFGLFPDAKIVFLARNPLDLAASLKRRGNAGDTVRMVWGWRIGVSRALRLQAEQPNRLRVFRYEDVVQNPTDALGEVCRFADLTFDPAATEVAHVNRSEAKYALTSEASGMTASRVGYYTGILRPAEQQAVRMLAGPLLDGLYPGLGGRTSLLERVAAGGVLLKGGARLAVGQLRRIAADPVRTVRRTARRLRS